MVEQLMPIIEWVNNTQVIAQIEQVDIRALFTNAYFLVPFIALVVYFIYKQAFSNLIITALIVGLWWFSGTDMVQGAVVKGHLQLDKVLPVAGVGVAGISILIYLIFIRQD